jgi:hypothetical protein
MGRGRSTRTSGEDRNQSKAATAGVWHLPMYLIIRHLVDSLGLNERFLDLIYGEVLITIDRERQVGYCEKAGNGYS